MLDTETKRRIDSARDILVGKVPDPKSQVEQITIALIYKFMADMDAESEEMGGKRTFFSGDWERYGWPKLMRSGLGGHEVLALYGEAISKMPQNAGIPALFRDIFKNAYLPYRDPETLKSFLKIIDEFEYDHSERLGDAFEYLLSVLGSQGDAGQFRTPRHIIDFMVEIVDPKKDETILDPACGTAGFLISSYKHIAQENQDKNGNSTLTPDDKGRLANNFHGYDISPDMVRLSLVNLYLHGFSDPHIEEYDTLTSDEKWNEYVDIVLANPPFMSPKGGIKPHKRFSVQSKRSEVLFVDYIAEHLTPNGRAAVIVPEGIIFQAQTAYKQLRKMLVDEYLVAVVSLPAGVFQPYSGVKTSILLFDKSLAKQSNTIGFFKVENDGFGLGAQRREIQKNDLPQVHTELEEFLNALRNNESVAELQPTLGLIVEKERIAENGEYNLSGERYRDSIARTSTFPLVPFTDVCTLEYGGSLPKAKRREGKYPVAGSNGITGFHDEYLIEGPAIVVGRKGSAGEVTWIEENCFPIDTTYYIKLTAPETTDMRFVYRILTALDLPSLRGGAGIPGLNRTDVYNAHKIPLPPLEVQKEIVAEIEGYQKVIDGARAVLDNYRPHIPIHPDWPIAELGQVCDAILTGPFGTALHQSDYVDEGIPVINPKNIVDGKIQKVGSKMVAPETRDRLEEFTIRENDIVIGRRGEMGRCGVATAEMNGWLCGTGCFVIRLQQNYDVQFAFYQVSSPATKSYLEEQAVGVTMKNLNQGILSKVQMPNPAIEIQLEIVNDLRAECALVAANHELVDRMEKKIQAAIARVWGEEEPKLIEAE